MTDRQVDRCFAIALATAIAVGMLACGLMARADETPLARDNRPVLYIYTAPKWRIPCRRLGKYILAGKLDGFRIIYLEPPEDCAVPCLYWRNERGQWEHFMGWRLTAEKLFMEKYVASMRRKL